VGLSFAPLTTDYWSLVTTYSFKVSGESQGWLLSTGDS
jgi:hypothetical protein